MGTLWPTCHFQKWKDWKCCPHARAYCHFLKVNSNSWPLEERSLASSLLMETFTCRDILPCVPQGYKLYSALTIANYQKKKNNIMKVLATFSRRCQASLRHSCRNCSARMRLIIHVSPQSFIHL
jgi:hypothetical protein